MGRILICPLCGSTRIVPLLGGYLGQVYRCLDCGYRGVGIEVEKEDVRERKPS